jgi:DNA-binding response OmpR family regulator
MKTTILLVEDETSIREVVRQYLEKEGYEVLEAKTGLEGLVSLRQHHVDLLILDIMLPQLEGYDLAERLRQDRAGEFLDNQDAPIIFLTARKEEHDRLKAFSLGGDDYMTKPFSSKELVARVKAVLRRSAKVVAPVELPVTFHDMTIDPRSRTLVKAGVNITLTAKEFDLLWFFARHPRQVFSRAQLLDNVWGYEFFGDDSTVTVHVRRLREKIEPNPTKPTYIQTVWGIGYKLDLPE